MKSYELSILFHPDLEMNLDPALGKVAKIVESNGGTIDKLENDGKKRLAYPINSQDFAVYYYYTISLPADAPAKVCAALNIADEILRYLLVRTDERRLKAEARAKVRAEKAAAYAAKVGAEKAADADEATDASEATDATADAAAADAVATDAAATDTATAEKPEDKKEEA